MPLYWEVGFLFEALEFRIPFRWKNKWVGERFQCDSWTRKRPTVTHEAHTFFDREMKEIGHQTICFPIETEF